MFARCGPPLAPSINLPTGFAFPAFSLCKFSSSHAFCIISTAQFYGPCPPFPQHPPGTSFTRHLAMMRLPGPKSRLDVC